MSVTKKSYPVAPNSVYVWRGFKNTDRSFEDFAGFLGNVFVPACMLLQPPVGLRAYYPTLVPQENKNNVLPDQTALMFWDTPASHNMANETVAVRVYQNLHGTLYDMKRSKTREVPVMLPASVSEFELDQPYYLFEQPADWMMGVTLHVVGSRPDSVLSADFRKSIFNWAHNFSTQSGGRIDASLVCCNADYAVAWVHSADESADISTVLDQFKSLIDVHLDIVPREMKLDKSLWSNWAGIDYSDKSNTSLNVQFERKENTIPT